MESIGEIISKLIKAEIRISEGYKEQNEPIRDELVKELDRRIEKMESKLEQIDEIWLGVWKPTT